MEPVYLAVAFLGILTIVLQWTSSRWASPGLAIFARWTRWFFLALSFALILQLSGFSSRPFWMLAASGFLGWFLLETLYNWIAIDALSRSELALFPRFEENTKGDEWPNLRRTIALRDWLRKESFRKRKALVASITPDLDMRSVIYENDRATIRLQVLFLPQRHGRILETLILTSQTEDGVRLITDNVFLPFGGFYPEDWHLERKPWTRSAATLLRRHKERIEASGKPLKAQDREPVDDLNAQQHQLDRLNTELGFLWPYAERDEHGKITREGRYRVWKELWALSYFGRALSY